MKIKRFLNHRHTCPLCNSMLNLSTNNGNKISFIANKIAIHYDVFNKSFSKEWTYVIVIDSIDNSFIINFLDKQGNPLNYISSKKIDIVKQKINNDISFRLCKKCLVCQKYGYDSTYSIIYLNECFIDCIIANKETLIINNIDENFYFKTIYIHNDLLLDKSFFTFKKEFLQEDIYLINYFIFRNHEIENANYVEIPFVPFSSKEQMIKKLSVYQTFS